MHKNNTELAKITKVLNEFKINDIGKSSGFCCRQRVVKPFELVMSLLTALGDKSVDSISDLHRYFTGLTFSDVQYKPFHNQLSKPEFRDMMKRLVAMAMGNWQQQILGTDVNLSMFEQIVVQDGSSFAVHDSLSDVFKGRFTTISPAAVEIHVSWDMLSSQPHAVSVSADSKAEYDYLPPAASLGNKLFLADRGYFKLSYLRDIHASGGFYTVRAKTTSNPLVAAAYTAKGKRLKRFKSVSLKKVKAHIRRSEVVDMDVENPHGYRMIASWPKDKNEPTYWVTNLPRSEYPANSIIKLYGLRWQIELLFKEWKSYCNLRKFNTRKASMMEGLIWVSLLALLVKRRIGFSIQQLKGIAISSFMVAKNTQGWFYKLMESIIHFDQSTLIQTWNWAVDYLARYAKRAHPDRDRESGRLAPGLTPIIS
ncbi:MULTISPECIES: IS4 family transposase [Paraglaciecola]|jgi:hypothetical protein|uniref:Transposase n=2 Tax=Paraglaciecola TaxID=1621534 RepID=K6Z8C1_9ALTE|nr:MULTISPECIES: IS4 family transposase [Paraglaciecola]MAD14797.1 IS4/IS5 family transposase [Alteromonadaceae bacterium]GAC25238.1 transposase [Paraglaciecola mesophila KMM 241]GAC33933.1 transposase [Paraglaciecola polaris LMG 21857]|tara:strand:+ start:100 stop:1371 length:1272 start_codon:yes stop_codon:yes gene_type:complete